MKYFLLFLLLLAVQLCPAQNPDSLLQVANTLPKKDTTRLQLLMKSAWNYQYSNIKKGLQLAETSLLEAKQTNYNQGIYKLLVTNASINQTLSNFDKSIAQFNEAIALANSLQKYNWLSTSYVNLANTYNLKGDAKNAFINYEKAIELNQKYNPDTKWGDIYMNIGALYYQMQDVGAAMRKFKLGLQDTLLDAETKCASLSNICNLYCADDNKDSSKHYLKLLTTVYEANKNSQGNIQIFYFFSKLEYQIKFEKSNKDISNFNTAIELATTTQQENQLGDFTRLKMKFFENFKQYDSAIVYGEKTNAINKKLKDFFHLKNDSKSLATYYSAVGNLTAALQNMQLHSSANDSVYSQQSATASRNAEIKYESKQKEEKNIALEKEKNTQSKLKNVYLLLGTLTSLLIGIIAYSFFRSKIKTEKLNIEIENKSIELEKSNAFKTKILSIISHDVRAPIIGLQNLISLQNSGVLSDEKSKELDVKIENSLKHTSHALDNLLHWSIGQMGNTNAIASENFLLEPIVIEQINFLTSIIESKNMLVEYTGDKNISIQSDKNAIALIIRNLLSNAIKFSKLNSKIIMTQHNVNTITTITIIDFGAGISTEKIAQLGKQFTESNVGTANEKGIGLGHVLIAEYAKQINATITIESQIGVGTAVYVALPNNG